MNSTLFKNSTILTNEKSSDLVKLIGLKITSVKLLYQASKDGFDPSIFHSKCDGVSSTLIVIKSKNSNIFGGFTSAAWSGKGYGTKSDSTAFLFSILNSYNVSVKMDIFQPIYAISASPYSSIVFGGDDLRCTKDQCYSNLGQSYKIPSFLTENSYEAYSFLGGSPNFQAVEIEVYWINF